MIKFNQSDVILSNIAAIVEKRIDCDENLELVIDKTMGEFEGKYKDGVITAGSHSQVLDIAGRFIRNPKMDSGYFKSHKEVCGIYLATHNYNFYEVAPLEELCAYIDDVALWGMNTIQLWFDMYYFESMEDGKSAVERYKALIRYCKSIGVKTIMGILANEAFHHSPEHLRADWTCGHDGYIYNLNDHYHVEICPSKDGGMEQILEYRRSYLEEFRDASPDFISIGAYDEGGCTCSKCAPWGINGFVRCCEEIIKLIKEYMPETQIIISMWQFDTFTGTDVEHSGMKKLLENGKLSECRYLVSEPQYAKYPYEKGMPKPLIGFPEISMCATIPWGGYGANPIPNLMQQLWNKNGDKMEGGLPYCEGFYEDINKVIMLRLFRDNQSVELTVKEYLAYEFKLKGDLLDRTAKAVMNMEETLYRGFEPGHRYPVNNPEKILEIEKVMIEANESLPENIRSSKKWQMLYLRGVIDGELYRNDFKRNDKVLEYFNKIIELSYLQNANFCIKPDIIEDDKYGRVLTKEELKIIAAGGKID